jgi:hypothetical protein
MLIVSCAKVWLERKSDRFEDEPTAFQILVDVEEFAAVGELYLLLQVGDVTSVAAMRLEFLYLHWLWIYTDKSI